MKKWIVASYDKELAKELAEECDIDPVAALIATARGFSDPSELDEFLSDEPCFSDPKELADITLAAEIINEEIEKGTKIAVYGDYDCDGVTATALLYSYLSGRGADCVYYIPDRFDEGYGMNCAAVEELCSEGVGLLITVDNGISCEREIARAKELLMKVIVTDHHIPPEYLPCADAVVDPSRHDCPSAFKSICGAQVAFSLICVLENREPEELLPYYADLLSLALVADVMPLVLENRSIVKCGIRKLKTDPATGLAALMNAAGIDKKSADAGRIAFGLAPRINAAGRMGKAGRALELLLCDNMLSALEIAAELDEQNTLRRKTEARIFAEATEKIEKNGYFHDRVIVVSGEGWHHGIVGIVAAKITEQYGCPAFVIAADGENAVGSGRGIEDFSLYDAVYSARDALTKFGGHKAAAGINLGTKNIDLFRRMINEYANSREYVPPVLRLDFRLNPASLTLELAEAVKQLEPFGTGNSVPVFGVYGVKLQKITPIGNAKHLRLIFTKELTTFQALLFGMTPERFCFCEGDVLDAAVTADTNYYNDELNLTVQIKSLRMSGTDDDRLFSQLDSFNSFASGRDFDAAALLPTREETGAVYKFISAKSVLPERVKYVFMNTLGYGKTMVSLLTLEELGLIENSGGLYRAAAVHKKTELRNSSVYGRILERSEQS